MKTKSFLIAALLVILLTVGFTWALAQNEPETYSACVNNSSGTIHMINEGESCNNNEELYEWNTSGPPGPQGPTGYVRFYTISETMTISPGIFSGRIQKCESGEDRATGGGYWTGLPFFNISHNHPKENSDGEPYAWHISGSNNHNQAVDITIYVICADMTP